MIQRFSHTSILVFDQDAAKDFYVNKLGFETPHGPEYGQRVSLADRQSQRPAGLPAHSDEGGWSEHQAGSCHCAEGTDGKRRMGGGVLQVDDCRATYEELKAKGVEFLSPPAERFYGIECVMKDNSNNWFSMTQPK
jgi:catechol 2,3-dioxygenase-like lactoylglutathione lyase family enzyme